MEHGKKGKLALYLLLVLLLVCVGYIVWKIMYTPHFRIISSDDGAPLPTPAISWVTHQGKFFSLQYPTSVSVYDKQNDAVTANKAVVEFWRVDQVQPLTQVVVQVLFQPDLASLSEFSSVALRRQGTQQYTESEILIDGKTGIQFVKEDRSQGLYEIGAFFMFRQHVYTIVLRSSDAVFGGQMYETMLSTLRFLEQ